MRTPDMLPVGAVARYGAGSSPPICVPLGASVLALSGVSAAQASVPGLGSYCASAPTLAVGGAPLAAPQRPPGGASVM